MTTPATAPRPTRTRLVVAVGALVVAGAAFGLVRSWNQKGTPSSSAAAADDRLVVDMQVLQKGVGGAINEIQGEGPAARQTLYIAVSTVPPGIDRPEEQVVLLAGEEGGTPSFVSAPNEDEAIVAAPVSWLYAPSATAKRVRFCLAAGRTPDDVKVAMVKTQDVWKDKDAKGCRSVEVSD